MTVPAGGRETPGAIVERLRLAERRIVALERSNDELSQLAVDVGHDLRVPLQVVMGFTDLLATRPAVVIDERSQEYVAVILSTVATMRAMLDGALECARVASAEYTFAPVDCHDLVTSVVSLLHPTITLVGATVEVLGLPSVVADRVQLARVFQNLLANALAHGRGDEALTVTVGARSVPGGWELSVADNGIGVPSADRQAIFGTYHRGSRTHERGDGVGAGLAICKRIIERHGGRIWVQPAPGDGAQFCFVLPMRDVASRPATRRADGMQPTPPSATPQPAHSRR